jgi:hypothetical protein
LATATSPPATATAGPSSTPRPTATAYSRQAFEDIRRRLETSRRTSG